MTPEAFITKWKAAELKERSAAQEHFLDLCRLLNEPTPAEADPKGESYCFERGATKTTGGKGWADVWKRGHFGWEYKGRGKDLTTAFSQLQQYAIALENPPLLVVCDLDRFRIHTNWNNTVSVVHEIALDDLRDSAARKKLKAVLSEPEQLRPGKTRQALTEQAAADFAKLAQRLRDRNHAPETVAHFINRLVFCMFAEDIGLLPNKMFARMLEHAKTRPNDFPAMAQSLFSSMRSGGMVGFEAVEWFNGGLFDDDTALELEKEEIELALRVAGLDWAEIDPTIFGTLFERGLDPSKRSQLGAHYTDRDKIMMIIEPVVVRPLLSEWEIAKNSLSEAIARAKAMKAGSARTKAENAILSLYRGFLDRLRSFTVLDPACGSGNFLYLALRALKDLENRVMIEAEALDLQREFPAIGPASVKGIEINSYAAELARVTVWIGEIQWMRRNGFDVSKNPILKPLQNIECRNALLNDDGSEAEWPEADVIIGNPPYVGDRWIVKELGEEDAKTLRRTFKGRLPASANLVCYWFEKAAQALEQQRTDRVGFVATSTIRNPNSRFILNRMAGVGRLYEAWSNIVWIEGKGKAAEQAALRVAITCYARADDDTAGDELRLDGKIVEQINPDLSARDIDLTTAVRLPENQSVAFQGIIPWGKGFVLASTAAREMLTEPTNVNGRPNSDVLFPYRNASDLTKRSKDRWLIHMGERTEQAAALYEKPFKHLTTVVRPEREKTGNPDAITRFWQLWRPRTDFQTAMAPFRRYIATPRVAEHRFFVWLPHSVLPDSRLVAIARDDDTFFGILESKIHRIWTLAKVSLHGVGDDPTYNTQEIFETFPFPEGLTPDVPAVTYKDDPRATSIAAAAKHLDELRCNWLNPAELVRTEPEVVPGFPDRVLPVNDKAATILKKRTLTNLYNERPAWLDNAHRDLDRAVTAAYGWPEDVSDDEVLGRLLAMNRVRGMGQDAVAPSANGDEEPEAA